MSLHVSSNMCSSSGGQNCIIQHVVIITLCRWPSGTQVDKVLTQPVHNFDLLMMSTYCSEHVEAFHKLIIKQEFVH